MRIAAFALVSAAVTGAVVAALLVAPGPKDGTASSHREAPLIADDPTADNTDLYAFRSPDKPDTVTIISNVQPGEDPAAGPNYYRFSAAPATTSTSTGTATPFREVSLPLPVPQPRRRSSSSATRCRTTR